MKNKLALLTFSALLLTACGTEKEETPVDPDMSETTSIPEVADSTEEDSTTSEVTSEENEDETVDQEDVEEGDLEDVSDDELEKSEEIDDFSEYEELDDLGVFNPDDYDGHLVTDNQGTRVMLFKSKEDNIQSYKTIFVKNNSRLKVIDLRQDKMVYNDVIK